MRKVKTIFVIVLTISMSILILDIEKIVHQVEVTQKRVEIKTSSTVNITIQELAYSLPVKPRGRLFKTLGEAVRAKSDSKGNILVTLVDRGYLDMAINFYEASLFPNNITNYLFMCGNKEACTILHDHGFDCFLYVDHPSGHLESEFGTDVYNEKTKIRIKIVIDILRMGYSVLHSDVDVYFYQNPFPYFNDTNVDFFISSDSAEATTSDPDFACAGFYFIRSKRRSKKLFKRISRAMIQLKREENDQFSVVEALKGFDKIRRRMVLLNARRFMNGCFFLSHEKRLFHHDDDPSCDSCVVVHYNCVRGFAKKEYLMKNSHHWFVDKYGYYSSQTSKYLMYDNPELLTLETAFEMEFMSLVSAFSIGQMLNRVVILPRFTCNVRRMDRNCHLNAFFLMGIFDSYFYLKYRENGFLNHPKVPDKIINSTVSNLVYIGSKFLQFSLKQKYFLRVKVNETEGDSMKLWFGDTDSPSVLQFSCLYNAISPPAVNRTIFHQMSASLLPEFKNRIRKYDTMLKENR